MKKIAGIFLAIAILITVMLLITSPLLNYAFLPKPDHKTVYGEHCENEQWSMWWIGINALNGYRWPHTGIELNEVCLSNWMVKTIYGEEALQATMKFRALPICPEDELGKGCRPAFYHEL